MRGADSKIPTRKLYGAIAPDLASTSIKSFSVQSSKAIEALEVEIDELQSLIEPYGYDLLDFESVRLGTNAAETIYAEHEGSLIYGADGNDTVRGRSGDDVMVGGRGPDKFVWDLRSETGDQSDTIIDLDFETGDWLFILTSQDGTLGPFGRNAQLRDLDDLRSAIWQGALAASNNNDGDGLLISVAGIPGPELDIKNLSMEDIGHPMGERTLLVAMSTGQSLSIGVTYFPNYTVIWDEPVDPDRAFMLDFGDDPQTDHWGWRDEDVQLIPETFKGFKPLRSSRTETHATTMVAQILDGYDDATISAPDILHFHVGVGGTSILQLMSSSDDVYNSVADALLTTSPGDVFLVPGENDLHSYYVNANGFAHFYKTLKGNPTQFDKVRPQFDIIAQEALAQDYTLQEKLAVAFIHGQADTNLVNDGDYDYSFLMAKYFDRIEAAVEASWGMDVELVVSVSQQRGYGGGGLAVNQLDIVIQDERVHLGAKEIIFESLYPSVPNDGNLAEGERPDLTHLSPKGYMMMGQTVGTRLFDSLVGNKDAPILLEAAVHGQSGNELILTFSGVEGYLVEDTTDLREELGFITPEHFGIGIYDDRGSSRNVPGISDSFISGDSEVTLILDQPISGIYQIWIGRNERSMAAREVGSDLKDWHYTSLRDSETDDLVHVPGDLQADGEPVREFAPLQYLTAEFDDWFI